MKTLALYAIRIYQRFLSPYKGFRCAYAAVSGRASCSALGYRAIRRFGLWRGLGVLDERLLKCGVAHRRHRPLGRARTHGPLAHQAGSVSCDLPCDACSWGDLGDACDACDVCDCASDWWRRKRRRDQDVIIPVAGDRGAWSNRR